MIRLKRHKQSHHIDEVLMALVYIDNLKDMQNFTTDLLTEGELSTLAARWKAVRMLSAGIVYSKVVQTTNMSSATIARLAKLLKRRAGGFNSMLAEMGV